MLIVQDSITSAPKLEYQHKAQIFKLQAQIEYGITKSVVFMFNQKSEVAEALKLSFVRSQQVIFYMFPRIAPPRNPCSPIFPLRRAHHRIPIMIGSSDDIHLEFQDLIATSVLVVALAVLGSKATSNRTVCPQFITAKLFEFKKAKQSNFTKQHKHNRTREPLDSTEAEKAPRDTGSGIE